MEIKITLATRTTDNRVLPENQLSGEWNDIVTLLSDFTISDKKDSVKMIVPVEFKTVDETDKYAKYTEGEANRFFGTEGELKTNNDGIPYVWKAATNIKNWYMLPVDIDGQMTIDEAVNLFKDYEFCLYTSHSHQSEKKPYDCFRMLFPLSECIQHSDFISRIQNIEAWLGEDNIDLSSLASFRAFYLPSHPKEREHLKQFIHNKGKLVDPFSFDVFVKPEPTFTIEDIECDDDFKEYILILCQELGNLEYNDWFNNICLPMTESGFTKEQFVSISRNMRSHRTGNAANASMVWESALNTNPTRGKKTLGSLVWFLKDQLGNDCFNDYKKEDENITQHNNTQGLKFNPKKNKNNGVQKTITVNEVLEDVYTESIMGSFEKKHTLTLAPTGSGKSYSMCVKALDIIEKNSNAKVALIVPSKSHIKQMVNTFMEVLETKNINEYNIDYFVSGGNMKVGESEGVQTFSDKTRIGITHFAYASRRGVFDRYYHFFDFIDENTHVFIDEIDAYIEKLTFSFDLGGRYKSITKNNKLVHEVRKQCGMSVGGTNCSQCSMVKYANRYTFNTEYSTWQYDSKRYFDESETFSDNDYLDISGLIEKELMVADTIKAYALKQHDDVSDLVTQEDSNDDRDINVRDVLMDYINASWKPTAYKNIIVEDGKEASREQIFDKYFEPQAGKSGLIVIPQSASVKFPRNHCNVLTITTMDRRPLQWFDKAASVHMVTALIGDVQTQFLQDTVSNLEIINIEPKENRKMEKIIIVGTSKKFNNSNILKDIDKNIVFKETKRLSQNFFDSIRMDDDLKSCLAYDQSQYLFSYHDDVLGSKTSNSTEYNTLVTHARGNLGRGIDLFKYKWVFAATNSWKPTCAFVTDDVEELQQAMYSERGCIIVQNIGRILRRNPNGSDSGIRVIVLHDLLAEIELNQIVKMLSPMSKTKVESLWLHRSVTTENRSELFKHIDEIDILPTDGVYTFDDILNKTTELAKQGENPATIKKTLNITSKSYRRDFNKKERDKMNAVLLQYKDGRKLSKQKEKKLSQKQKREQRIIRLIDQGITEGKIISRMKINDWVIEDQLWAKLIITSQLNKTKKSNAR